ncbi:hypothetical protein B0H14DRAFT_2630138 [Mycena olivaceomarginata]|nr:hypothetical protein B0H14DRAFT_2630138 [Mycena olivaceomarginata]
MLFTAVFLALISSASIPVIYASFTVPFNGHEIQNNCIRPAPTGIPPVFYSNNGVVYVTDFDPMVFGASVGTFERSSLDTLHHDNNTIWRWQVKIEGGEQVGEEGIFQKKFKIRPSGGESKLCLTGDPTSGTHWVIDVFQHEFYTSALEIAQKIAQEVATPIPKLESDKKMDAAAAGGDNDTASANPGTNSTSSAISDGGAASTSGNPGTSATNGTVATGETASQPLTGGDGGAADTSNTPANGPA